MIKGMCKHFTGINRNRCKKKIEYLSFTNGEIKGMANKIPCLMKNNIIGNEIYCSLAEWPTEKELETYKKEVANITNGMNTAIKIIKEKHSVIFEYEEPTGRNKSATGIIKCPVCGNDLRYRVAGLNGHIWGACKTKGCLSWMM